MTVQFDQLCSNEILSGVNEHQQSVWNLHTQQSHGNRGGYATGKTRIYWELQVRGTSVAVENHQS